jgi:hypothetical protein
MAETLKKVGSLQKLAIRYEKSGRLDGLVNRHANRKASPVSEMLTAVAATFNGDPSIAMAMKRSVGLADLQERLVKAKRLAQDRRWRITMPCFCIGILCIASGTTLIVVINTLEDRSHYASILGQVLMGPGLVLGGLAVLPADLHAARIWASIALFFTALINFWHCHVLWQTFAEVQDDECTSAGHRIPCSLGVFNGSHFIVGILWRFFIVLKVAIGLCGRPSSLLKRTWFYFGQAMLSMALGSFCLLLIDIMAPVYSAVTGDTLVWLVYFILGMVVLWSDFRGRAQTWLAKGEAQAAAAGIAVLLGGSSVHDVIEDAEQHFRCVYADKITQEDMAENTPNSRLYVHTEPACLGHVDAFLSHSWQDNAADKWTELQAWRREFKTKHSREPRLWIDKYCIDQRNIEASLKCLPVYLMGCKKLLVMYGESYLNRLWCLVEIFTFKEMGGLPSNVDIRILNIDMFGSSSHEFDIKKAKCATEEDTSHLRQVLEAGADGIDDLRRFIDKALKVRYKRFLKQDQKVGFGDLTTNPALMFGVRFGDARTSNTGGGASTFASSFFSGRLSKSRSSNAETSTVSANFARSHLRATV